MDPAAPTEPDSLTGDLSDQRDQIHGSLVEVQGLGVLILGPSGIGKSECVIELVRRRNRMVADDVVRLRLDETAAGDQSDSSGEGRPRLIGWSPEHIRHFIEVRGLGLLCVADLFGEEATLDECEVGFVARLEAWGDGAGFERIGLERECESLLGVEIPRVRLPVHAASNLATLVELAVRDWHLRERGVNAADRLNERLRARGGILGLERSGWGEER